MVRAPRIPASPGSFANKIVADGLVAEGRQPGDIGMHPRIFEERGLWAGGLPDLTVGRTLEAAIERLDAITFADDHIPTGWMEYADAWLEELRDIAGNASVTYYRDGEVTLTVGFPCGAQMEERQRRGDALCDHMRAREGAREAIMLQVEREGHVTDNRPVVMHDLVAATRAFIRTGGKLLLSPSGQPEGKADINLILASDDHEAAAAHWEAAKAFHQLARRGRARRPLARIARLCGEQTPNGWRVVSAKHELSA